MSLDKFVISVLVFTCFVVAGTLMISDMNTNYASEGTNISTEKFGTVYDTTEDIYNLSNDMSDFVLGGNIDDTNTADSMFRGVYSSARLLTTPFKLMGQILASVAQELGIPTVFVTLVVGAIAVFIIFGIMYLVFRITR